MQRWPFEPGKFYNRRADIHAKFGGQQQGGIATPTQHNVVFAFTGPTGARHGYSDGPRPDGTYDYCGEGQRGDMRLKRGNMAIASHARLSRDLLLFETKGKGQPVKFVGQYICGGWRTEQLPDTDGFLRAAIVFSLVPIEAVSTVVEAPAPAATLSEANFRKLRDQAWAKSSRPGGVASKDAVVSVFERSKAVRDYALARASGSCEACGSKAPFETPSGAPFLEVHHIKRLTDGGPDSPSAVAALCPNCHREAHYGRDAVLLNSKLQALILEVERYTLADLKLADTDAAN